MAYPFQLGARSAAVLRWPAGAAIGLYVEAGGPAGDGALTGAAAAAAVAWNGAAEAGEFRFEVVEDAARADVLVVWSDVSPPVDVAACRPHLTAATAVTTYCISGFEPRDACQAPPGRLCPYPWRSGRAEGGDGVRMVVTVASDLRVAGERLQRVVAHELGHVLGIGTHSPDSADLMWGGPIASAWPTAADRRTMRALYRTPPDVLP